MDEAQASELLSFWAARRALSDEAARQRLREVVCILREGGNIAGVSSTYQADVEVLGGRRFWVYRSLLDQTVADRAPEMIDATFTALQAGFDGKPGSPIGLCIRLAGPQERRQRPEAQWSNPRAIYAGYLPDGRQLRVAYFSDAQIAPPLSAPTTTPATTPDTEALLPRGYRIKPFAEQDEVSATDIIDLWVREGALGPDEANRRVGEILLVATDVQHQPAGVATAYLRRNDQLRAELWYTRVFVGADHRRSGLAIALAHAAREHMAQRHRSGLDRRGIGILFEVESEILKRFLPQAIWPRTEFAFVGQDARGSHIRVYYFPGVLAPEPE